MKYDRHLQALIIRQFNAWHLMSLPRSLSRSHPWSTSETPVGSVARSEAAPLPSRWAWPLHTALTIFHPSSQKHVDLVFFEKWRARHLTVHTKWECFLRALFFTFFQIFLKSSSFAYYQSSKPILIQGRLTLQRQLPNNAWNSTSFALHGNFFKLKRCQIKVHNQL